MPTVSAETAVDDPASLTDLISALKSHVIDRVGSFLDESAASRGFGVAQSMLDEASIDFPFLIDVRWEAERDARSSRRYDALREKLAAARTCRAAGCEKYRQARCRGYCRRCFRKSSSNGGAPREGGEGGENDDDVGDVDDPDGKFYFERTRVCGAEGCSKLKQYLCDGYCRGCFKKSRAARRDEGRTKDAEEGRAKDENGDVESAPRRGDDGKMEGVGGRKKDDACDIASDGSRKKCTQNPEGKVTEDGKEPPSSDGTNFMKPAPAPVEERSELSVADQEDRTGVRVRGKDVESEKESLLSHDGNDATPAPAPGVASQKPAKDEEDGSEEKAPSTNQEEGEAKQNQQRRSLVAEEDEETVDIEEDEEDGHGILEAASLGEACSNGRARDDGKKPQLIDVNDMALPAIPAFPTSPEGAEREGRIRRDSSPESPEGKGEFSDRHVALIDKFVKRRMTARDARPPPASPPFSGEAEGATTRAATPTTAAEEGGPDASPEGGRKRKRGPAPLESGGSDSEDSYRPSVDSDPGEAPVNDGPRNGAGRKSRAFCQSSGCSKFRASHCEGYCMKCYRALPPWAVAGNNTAPGERRGRKKAPSIEERILQCRAFLKEHGHLDIPAIQNASQPDSGDDDGLKRWARSMRIEYRDLLDGKYDADSIDENETNKGWLRKKGKGTVMNRLEMLEEIGFHFKMTRGEENLGKVSSEVAASRETSSVAAKKAPASSRSRVIFDMRLDQCRRFKAEKGHMNIATSLKKTIGLSEWSARMRSLYNQRTEGKTPLTPGQEEKLKQLESLGFAFDGAFDVNLQKLAAFKAEHGHTRLPQTYDPDRALGHWAEKCRLEHNKLARGERSDYLTFDRLRKLTAIGFSFSTSHTKQMTTSFDEWVAKVKAYREEHGTDPTGSHPELGNWVAKTRVNYNRKMDGKGKHFLSDEREQKLRDIGFSFRVGKRPDSRAVAAAKARPRKSWDDRLAEFVRWKERHGHPYVPTVCEGEDKHLGRWVAGQRMAYRAYKDGTRNRKYGILTAERALALANAGFAFNASGIRRTPKDEVAAAAAADVGEEQHREFGTQAAAPEWAPEEYHRYPT